MELLLVEDEPRLASRVSRALGQAGHRVEIAPDGPSALEAVTRKRFDLMLLAVNLPGLDGFEVLGRVRRAGVPVRVLMLGARPAAGATEPADDCLEKPYVLEELLARVDGLGRRADTPEEPVLRVGPLSMDVTNRHVLRGGERIPLSPREFDVLAIFMREPGRVISRDEICGEVWKREHEYDTRTVEIFIMRLRKKLDRPGAESVIGTVRGVGYLMRVPEGD